VPAALVLASQPGIDLGDQVEGLGLVVLAALLGAALGAERSLSDKPAGLRTHMLVSGTAAGVTWIGDLLTEVYQRGDPSRGLHAVITGIGFLGAGTIIINRSQGVVGLTTAAGLLFTATVGIMVGLGLPVVAVGSTVLAVVVVHGLNRLDHALARNALARDEAAAASGTSGAAGGGHADEVTDDGARDAGPDGTPR
jgi:putative Mg2+ transporter-C (MgtC) family protein